MAWCLSDRNPTWPLEHCCRYGQRDHRRLSDRNPTWPLEPATVDNLIYKYCLSDRNPTWPLELKYPTKTKTTVVSVIVILRGHLNLTADANIRWAPRLSDRNPTWPLEPGSRRSTSHRKSDRNPTWPLELVRYFLI